MPGNAEGALLNILLVGAFSLAIGTVVVPAFLTIGGSFLLIRSSEKNYRMAGLAALISGAGLILIAFLTIATTAI